MAPIAAFAAYKTNKQKKTAAGNTKKNRMSLKKSNNRKSIPAQKDLDDDWEDLANGDSSILEESTSPLPAPIVIKNEVNQEKVARSLFDIESPVKEQSKPKKETKRKHPKNTNKNESNDGNNNNHKNDSNDDLPAIKKLKSPTSLPFKINFAIVSQLPSKSPTSNNRQDHNELTSPLQSKSQPPKNRKTAKTTKTPTIVTTPSTPTPTTPTPTQTTPTLSTPTPTANGNELETSFEISTIENDITNNSINMGKNALTWLLNPITPENFFNEFWEKNACLLQRHNQNNFNTLISFDMIDEMLMQNHLEFTTNIDVTTYLNGKRETHNPEGRAMPPAVWSFYSDGCSIRILNPSTYLPVLRNLCTTLQEYFHCLVGANVYLTPPQSQGFAPHFDDIEAFVLQVEGRKRWRLYKSIKDEDILARISSGNFNQSELGPPIFDEVLMPGDLLYFPRGTIHQAVTENEQHSLHITLSVYQKQSYADLLEKLMPMVLEKAIKENLKLRRGLPLNTWQTMGLVHATNPNEQRTQFISDVQLMMKNISAKATSSLIDNAVDQLAKRFQHEALPPMVMSHELPRTVFGAHNSVDKTGICVPNYKLTKTMKIRLLRANILRLVAEDDGLNLYYCVDNALEYCKYEANFIEIEPEIVGAIELLIKSYPLYISISDLPLPSAARRNNVATFLWERGLLMTEKPFK